jgi:RNA polymerase sigma-70 factor (ECF subfamily)
LLEEYVPRVYRFAVRLTNDVHTAEDLTQETFLRAWRNLDRLREPEAVRVWLFRITANLWRDQLRRGRSPIARAGPLSDEYVGRALTPETTAGAQEQADRAMDALAMLPDRQREVLYLNACEGLAAAHIAEVLGISTEAAKASLSLARKRMREELRDVFDALPDTPKPVSRQRANS